MPCVLVTVRGNIFNFPNLSSVAIDDEAAAEFAIDYLFSQGHQKIGILGGDFAISDISRQRYQGCIRCFQKNGMEFDKHRYYESSRFSYQDSYEAMKRLFQKAKDLTVVFAMSDVMAIGAIRALIDCGKRVPEDISVMGFDGITLAGYYNPKLTTIQQQYQILADKSVEILLQSISGGHAPVHEVVPFHLFQGESVKKLQSGLDGCF